MMASDMEDTYRTLAGPCEGLFKAKGSKHFGYGFPIASESEVKVHLEALKKQHHAARHVAYAWMLGFDGTHHRSSDDGEPSNSAGPPILGVIRAHDRPMFCSLWCATSGAPNSGLDHRRYRGCGRAPGRSSCRAHSHPTPSHCFRLRAHGRHHGTHQTVELNLPPPTFRFPVRWKWTFA